MKGETKNVTLRDFKESYFLKYIITFLWICSVLGNNILSRSRKVTVNLINNNEKKGYADIYKEL